MNRRLIAQSASRWLLLLYLAVLTATGVGHACPAAVTYHVDDHAALHASHGAVDASGDCPVCTLQHATESALAVTVETVAATRQAKPRVYHNAERTIERCTGPPVGRGPPSA